MRDKAWTCFIFLYFFDETSSDDLVTRDRSETSTAREKAAIKSENMLHQQLAGELRKEFVRKFEKRKV